MSDGITILLFFIGIFLGYFFWRFVFRTNKRLAVITISGLVIWNVMAVVLFAEDDQRFVELIRSWFVVTFVELVIGLALFFYDDVKNSSFVRSLASFGQSFMSGFAKGVNSANYQVGGGLKTAKESRQSFKAERKSKKNKDDHNINSKKESANQGPPKIEVSSVKKYTDSTKRACCFNCQYWMGNRQLASTAGNFIEYEDSPAKCAPGGGRQHANVSPRATCNSFTRQFG
jgi:hypothetical protein